MPNINITAEDILEVKHWCWLAARAQVSINVTHYRISGVDGGGTAAVDGESLASNFSSAMNAAYKALLPDSALFVGTSVKRIDPTASVEVGSADDSDYGSDTGDPLPTQVCGFIHLASSATSRSGRGRVYVPFPTETWNNAFGAPTAAYFTLVQALATAMLDKAAWAGTGGSGTCQLVVWSRLFEGASTVTEALARSRWATQRRRGMFGSINDLPDWAVLP